MLLNVAMAVLLEEFTNTSDRQRERARTHTDTTWPAPPSLLRPTSTLKRPPAQRRWLRAKSKRLCQDTLKKITR